LPTSLFIWKRGNAMRNSQNSGWKAALPFLLPSLAGFAVFSILPMVMLFLISFTDWDGLSQLTLFSNFSGFMGEFFIGFKNFADILKSPELYQVLFNTVKYVALYIPLMLVAAMAVALVLNSHCKGVGLFRVVYYIPVLTSWVAGSLIWRWVLSPEYGVINAMLAAIGIEGPEWLQSPQWAMPAIVLASVWKDMGYFGLMLMSGLQGINRTYYEAAEIDGASKVRQFFRITLPLLTPTLFFVLIISLINSFQLFPQVMIMTPDGGPSGSTMVMVERIYKYGFKYYKMGYASAYSLILFVILLILTGIQMKLQNKWVNYDD
jgi:multiple sugar transport system permease protein